jgi:hypothetical protein
MAEHPTGQGRHDHLASDDAGTTTLPVMTLANMKWLIKSTMQSARTAGGKTRSQVFRFTSYSKY